MKPALISVPGKFMLAGEYAVLEGGPSLAVCVDRRLIASITPSDSVLISSNIWERTYRVEDHNIPNSPLTDTVKWALEYWSPRPFHLKIDSEICISDGLGSSTAVRLASLAAIAQFQERQESLWDLAHIVWEQQKREQGFASGYDIATQCNGGLTLMQPKSDAWPGELNSLPWKYLDGMIHPFRGGKGAPTEVVGRSTRSWLQNNGRMDQLIRRSEELIDALILYNRSGSCYESLIKAVVQQRQIFEDNNNFPLHLLEALKTLEGFDQTWTFKTTGAGGEDSVLLIGPQSKLAAARHCLSIFHWQPLDASICSRGILINEQETL